MLRCVLGDVEKNAYEIQPLVLRISVDEGVPADSLYAVFPYREAGELSVITVFRDNDVVFKGVVDEEERAESKDGDFLKISARSLAALMLDNEAAPCCYDHPTVRLIYERYAAPFGITLAEDKDTVYFGEQNVLKGASCYSVVRSFCLACYSSLPRVSGDGVLYPKGICRDGVTRFGADGERYISLSRVRKRCEEISAVYVKTANAGGYSLPVENKNAEARGIKRDRYLNAVLTESPMSCADGMIRNGYQKAYELRLRCTGCLLGTEGNKAVLEGYDETELYISSVHYKMTSGGEYTDIRLKRRIS